LPPATNRDKPSLTPVSGSACTGSPPSRSRWAATRRWWGLLFEADFEEETARLRLPDGGVVTVAFTPDLADDIHEALRSQARLDGLVRYDSRTSQATHVELRAVERSMQAPLDAEAFWRSESFATLQAAQGRTGHVDPTALAINDLTDRERADFLAALDA
jgi:hypothetical protein